MLEKNIASKEALILFCSMETKVNTLAKAQTCLPKNSCTFLNQGDVVSLAPLF